MSTVSRFYKPVTIVTEDEYGRVGTEEWPMLSKLMIIARCRELSDQGWEPQEVQVDEAQGTLELHWWERSNVKD